MAHDCQMKIQLELKDCYKKCLQNISRILSYSSIILDQPIESIYDLTHSTLLSIISEKLNIDLTEKIIVYYDQSIFLKVMDHNGQVDKFIQQLNLICIQIDLTPDLDNYSNFIRTITLMLQKVSQIKGIPAFDFNQQIFTEQTISQQDIEYFLNIYGQICLKQNDINQDLQKEPKFYQNNLWAVYVLLTLSQCALSLQYVNTVYYISYRGATASDIANLTTFFNLVQMPCSIFWLWISDRIGRKTVYIIINIIYLLTTCIFVLIGFIVNNQTAIIVTQALRGIQGIGAVLTPISFLMATDLAPPRIRGFVIVLINVFALVGSLLSAPLQIIFSTLGKYKTTSNMPFDQVFQKISLSFIDSQITSIAFYFINLCVAIFFLKESSYNVKLKRYLRKNSFTRQEETKVLSKLKINKNIIILFVGYLFSLTADSNLRIGGTYLIIKNYGFTDPNQARAFQSKVTLISMTIGIIVVIFFSKPMIKLIGECRAIVLTQCLSIFEALINFAINPPVNPNLMYLTITTSTIASIFCDSLFMQLLSMYTKPESRGRLMGIFQIGNSIGRTSSGFIIGQLQNYNYRDALVLNTIFCSFCLIFVSIMSPPLQTNQMNQEMKNKRVLQPDQMI